MRAQLTGQVEQLRNEKSDLREQLDEERADANLTRAFALATVDDLLGELLTDRTVAVITTPGVEKQTVDGTTERQEQAAASITDSIDMQETSNSPEQRALRTLIDP